MPSDASMIWKLTPASWSRRAQQRPARPAPIIKTSGLDDMLAVSSRDSALAKIRSKETHILRQGADIAQAGFSVARTVNCGRGVRKKTAAPSNMQPGAKRFFIASV